MKGTERIRTGRLTLARLFALYFELRTPRKSATEQKADERRIGLFLRFLGRDKDPAKITRGEWERFITLRRAGELGGGGRAVRNRTIEADLRWLIAVLNWGHRHEDRDGRRLLDSNPVAGYELPREKNPRRPIATQEQYEALRTVSDTVRMELRDRARRVPVRSYLSEILDLAHWTGRRISAVLALRFEDLQLGRTPAAPHGAITWPAETDKEGRAWERVPVTPEARAAIDRIMEERPGIGSRYLFPAPTCSRRAGRGAGDRPARRRSAASTRSSSGDPVVNSHRR